jgi:hypothetical protein
MSSILLDGQGVAEAACAMGNGTGGGPGNDLIYGYEHVRLKNDGWISAPVSYDALVNIVYAIVLWDRIYLLKEKFNSRWLESTYFFQQHGVPFTIIDGPQFYEAEACYNEMARSYGRRHGYVELFPYMRNEFAPEDEEEQLFLTKNDSDPFNVSRTREYINMASVLGMDYLPSARRQMLLERWGINGHQIRIDAMQKMDKTLQDYYNGTNELMGEDRFKFALPILIDYLMQRYSTSEDIIKAALELKNERNVVLFRRELDELEEALVRGDIREVRKYFGRIEETVNEIGDAFETKRQVRFEVNFLPATVAIPIRLKLDVFNPKAYQLLFMKDLAAYGTRVHQMINRQRWI